MPYERLTVCCPTLQWDAVPKAPDMTQESRIANSITVNRVPIDWHGDGSRFSFFGVEGIIFWKNPSLLSLLTPLRDEVGEELYALLEDRLHESEETAAKFDKRLQEL